MKRRKRPEEKNPRQEKKKRRLAKQDIARIERQVFVANATRLMI